MRAEPFGDADSLAERRADFRNHLRSILDANRHIGERLPADDAANDQITRSMEVIRSYDLPKRREVYDEHRIRNQRTWYAEKASRNRRASRRFFACGIALYAMAIVSVLIRIAYPDHDFWPTEPIIVLAASVVGWTQVKKFNELASSYTLTAHEIGIIQIRIKDISDEISFSEFVNEAEQAFSREHTQWVARQQHA